MIACRGRPIARARSLEGEPANLLQGAQEVDLTTVRCNDCRLHTFMAPAYWGSRKTDGSPGQAAHRQHISER